MPRNHFVPPARMRLPVRDMREPAAQSPAEAENIAERAVYYSQYGLAVPVPPALLQAEPPAAYVLLRRTRSVPAETQVRIEAPDDTGFPGRPGFPG